MQRALHSSMFFLVVKSQISAARFSSLYHRNEHTCHAISLSSFCLFAVLRFNLFLTCHCNCPFFDVAINVTNDKHKKNGNKQTNIGFYLHVIQVVAAATALANAKFDYSFLFVSLVVIVTASSTVCVCVYE